MTPEVSEYIVDEYVAMRQEANENEVTVGFTSARTLLAGAGVFSSAISATAAIGFCWERSDGARKGGGKSSGRRRGKITVEMVILAS